MSDEIVACDNCGRPNFSETMAIVHTDMEFTIRYCENCYQSMDEQGVAWIGKKREEK